MGLLGRVLGIVHRRPKAKRRFNLLRDEAPNRLGRQRGFSVLGPFVLYAGIPLAGIWQIQSDLDPLLTKTRVSGHGANVDVHRSSLPDPFPENPLAGEELKPLGAPPGLPPRVSGAGGNDGGRPAGSDAQPGTPGLGALNAERGADRVSGKTGVPKGFPAARRARHVQSREEAFYRKAQGYHKAGNFEMAVDLYRQVLRENPDHRDALFQLSSIYMEKSAYAEAYPLVLELVKRDPRDARALVNLAIAEIALGRHEKAVPHLDHALTLEDPPRFEIYFHKGVVLSRLQRLEEAVTWYRKSEDLDPGHGPLLFNMAVTFDKLERYEEALDCYGRFLEAGGPSSPRERGDVEARIGVLTAYLTQGPVPSGAEGARRIMDKTEQAR